jgi:Protein of unknown function (DUF2442)
MAILSSFERANRRGMRLHSSTPRIIAANYDRTRGQVVIHLSSRMDLSFSPHDAQGLDNAKPAELEEIEISPSGFGMHFPKLDVDLYLPGLLEGLLGSKRWIASRLGQMGGISRSPAKRAAARANGKLGGRPKKLARR